jgi:hypothetical protein
MVNYKQLLTDLKAIAYHHPQINSFGFGTIEQCTSDVETKQEPKYTRMYVVPQQVTLNENHMHYMFSIIVMDQVDTTLSNLNDVLSDTMEITKDIWTIMYHSYTAEQGAFSNYYFGEWSPDITPFTERFDTILAGWTMNINVSVPFDYNTCVVPIEFGYGFPEDESFASYRVIIKDLQRFADLHYQINSFGFGDIKQLTNDIITKQEPEYPRMYVVPETTRFDPNHMHITFNIVVADQVNSDMSNQQDVLSDTLEIIKDLYAKMYLSEYEVDWDAVVSPFLEQYETTLAGWTLTVSMTQKFDFNRCVLPETSFVPGYTWAELDKLWKDVNDNWENV